MHELPGGGRNGRLSPNGAGKALGLRLAVLLAALLLLPPLQAGPPGIQTPADLVAFLRKIEGKHTISGQYVGKGDMAPVEALHASTGKWLGLISGDYYLYDQTGGIPDTSLNGSAISYWKAGGLVVLNLHMSNPTTGGPVYDTSRLDAAGLLTPGTATNTAFMNSLSRVAAGLAELQEAGVVVIFRPFHENGGDWFWWGKARQNSAQMVALWRFTHDYMEKTRGLHNLVWLFESGQPDVPTTLNYPGDAYVDMIGQDVYTDHPGDAAVVDAYRTMVSTGKLVCMAEFGPKGPHGGDLSFDETALVGALKAKMPRTVLFIQWWDLNAGRVGWGMASTRNAKEALGNPWIVNRDNVGLAP
ncbi:MAG TPA: glycosyl hydrolase [Opitutaceae bacterium]